MAKTTVVELMASCQRCGNEYERLAFLPICLDCLDRTLKANTTLIDACNRIVGWLDRLVERAEQQAESTTFETLKEACAADAKNYRATAADVRKAIATATLAAAPAAENPT